MIEKMRYGIDFLWHVVTCAEILKAIMRSGYLSYEFSFFDGTFTFYKEEPNENIMTFHISHLLYCNIIDVIRKQENYDR